jgi:tRNA U34 5-methylaminomethyl-2-thiouridine-forming methyltransferase MnmC
MQTIKQTADGSPTIFDDNFGESLHSAFGSITESRHIFIEHGLLQISKLRKSISILEIGYGSGLNATLSYEAAKQHHLEIHYQGIEKYPPSKAIQSQFNAALPISIQRAANRLSEIAWNKSASLSSFFNITKLHQDFLKAIPNQQFDLIYFDPFSPEKHPEAWDASFLQRISENHMKAESILLTYSSKGVVKQGLRAAGLTVKRLNGPPGKRHILRAIKS